MEWIILIFALIVAAYLYYFKRPFFDKHRGFIELSLIIFTALFTIYQVRSSTEDFSAIVDRMDSIITKAEESSKSLQNVDLSLSKLPQQMDSLSKSIESFNGVISSQKEQLTFTLNGLNSSIHTFRSTIDSMIERFNRKPDLDIDLHTFLTDTSRVIYKIVITNRGKLLADIYRMTYKIDSNYVISITDAKKIDNAERNATYQKDFPTPISLFPPAPPYDATSSTKFDCNIILTSYDNYYLRMNVYYKASFGNDGIETVIFIFSKNKEQPEKMIIKTD